MDFATLGEFVALADNLNYSQTAKSLYISQSQLSKHIKALEGELGVRLFARTTHSVSLTEPGALLAKRFKALLADFDKAVNEAHEIEKERIAVFRVVHLSAVSARYLPKACQNFHEIQPSVRLSLKAQEVDEVIESVTNGDADVGIALLADGIAPRGLEYRVLSIDSFGILVRKGHPFARRKTIKLADLHGLPVLAPSVDFMPNSSLATQRFLEREDNGPIIRKEMNDISSIAPFLVSSNGVACTVSHVARHFEPDFKFVPFEDDGYMKPLYVIIWRNAGESSALLDFVDCVQNSFWEACTS